MIPDLGGQIDNLVQQLWECDVRYQESVREFKRRFITRVLTEHNGNQCAAAESLGMHRNTLARTITELKIDFQHCKPGYQRRIDMRRRPAKSRALRMRADQTGATA